MKVIEFQKMWQQKLTFTKTSINFWSEFGTRTIWNSIFGLPQKIWTSPKYFGMRYKIDP